MCPLLRLPLGSAARRLSGSPLLGYGRDSSTTQSSLLLTNRMNQTLLRGPRIRMMRLSLFFMMLLSWLLTTATQPVHAQCLTYQTYQTPGLYTYTVPAGGPFLINVTGRGADGGDGGGSGATVVSRFALQGGDQLTVIVGEAGQSEFNLGGGGGGTAVVLTRSGTRSLLLVAGGGGGGNAFYRLIGDGGQGRGPSAGGAGGATGAGSSGGGGGGGLDGAGSTGAVGRRNGRGNGHRETRTGAGLRGAITERENPGATGVVNRTGDQGALPLAKRSTATRDGGRGYVVGKLNRY